MNPEYFQHLVQTSEAYQGYSFKPVDRPSQNTLLYFSNPGHKSYYLKIFSDKPDEMGESSEMKAQRELIVSRLIQETLGIPTSRSIYLGEDNFGSVALLQEEVFGLPFDTLMNEANNFPRESIENIALEAGIYLSRIHRITSSSFGDISNIGDKFLTWEDCFTQNMTKHLEIGLGLGILNKKHVDYFIDRLNSPLLNRFSSTPTLCHGDFAPQNIIIDTDSYRIAGIVDFELAKYWIPGWDLVRSCVALELTKVNSDLMDAFIKGYASLGRLSEDDIRLQIEYYKPFENLNYWIWAWSKSGLQDKIKADISGVTGIPY